MDEVIDLLGQLGIWLLKGGGAAIVAYWLLEHVGFLKTLSSEAKRYASLILSGGLGAVAFALLVGVGVEAAPPDAAAWLDALLVAAGLAAGLAQGLHGRLKLRG
jgi:hypothetical protein